jgi:hypothetical protein
MRPPRLTEPLDRLLVSGGDHLPLGVLACFNPVLPRQAGLDHTTWTRLRVRRDERWREHQGPVGDALRALAAAGAVVLGADGIVRDPASGDPLTKLPDVVGFEGGVEGEAP